MQFVLNNQSLYLNACSPKVSGYLKCKTKGYFNHNQETDRLKEVMDCALKPGDIFESHTELRCKYEVNIGKHQPEEISVCIS